MLYENNTPSLINNPLMQDYAQDYIGARALLDKTKDLYPVLSDAFVDIGINWNAPHLSTHPPTAYLFALPLSLLPIGIFDLYMDVFNVGLHHPYFPVPRYESEMVI